MNNNVYTVKVLGRDLQLNDIVLYDNQLFIVDIYDVHKHLCKLSNVDSTINWFHSCRKNKYYHRVTVGQPPDTTPHESEFTCAATDSDVESFIDIRAYWHMFSFHVLYDWTIQCLVNNTQTPDVAATMSGVLLGDFYYE